MWEKMRAGQLKERFTMLGTVQKVMRDWHATVGDEHDPVEQPPKAHEPEGDLHTGLLQQGIDNQECPDCSSGRQDPRTVEA
jgi:hypothetical protein